MKYGPYKKRIEQQYACSIVVACKTSDRLTTATVSAWKKDTFVTSANGKAQGRAFAVFFALESVEAVLQQRWLSTQCDADGQYDMFGHDRYKRH